jgi:hypothetical protein
MYQRGHLHKIQKISRPAKKRTSVTCSKVVVDMYKDSYALGSQVLRTAMVKQSKTSYQSKKISMMSLCIHEREYVTFDGRYGRVDEDDYVWLQGEDHNARI